MKKNVKFTFRILTVFSMLLIFQAGAFAKEYKSKTIKKSLDAKPNVFVLHKYGPLQIEASDDNQVHFEAMITFDASSEADANALFNQFDIRIGEKGNELVLETDFNVKNWNQTGGNIRLKFADGTKVKGINKLKINMVVKLPKVDYLKLKNKYDKIKVLNNLESDLEVSLYEGQLSTNNISGDLELYLKYSSAEIGNFQKAKIELYECNLAMGNGKKVNINSKYSKWAIGSTLSLVIDAYEGRGEAGIIKGHISINSKYFRFKAASFETAEISMYEGCFTANSGKSLKGENKYGCLNLTEIGDLNLGSSYESDLEIGKIGNLTLSNAKYTNCKIEELNGAIDANTYEGVISVKLISAGFSGIKFESKYTNLKTEFSPSVKYRLEGELQYTDLDFPENKFEKQVYIEKNDKISVKGKLSGANDSSPLIKLSAYEGNITLN